MILKEGIVSSNMTSLILTGVGLTRSALSLIAECPNLRHLKTLKLDQNAQLPHHVNILSEILMNNSQSLKVLDLSSCGFRIEEVKDLCPVFQMVTYLEELVIWENRGIGDESIRREILPLLQNMPHLKRLPPVIC